MTHLGDRLRQQRLAKGVELSRIAEETRISVRYLEAIEKGDWKQLPGSIFARSFVRQYARHIGIEESSLENELQSLFQVEEQLPVVEAPPRQVTIEVPTLGEMFKRFESPFGDGFPKPLLSLIAVLVLCSGIYMGWQKIVLGLSGADHPQQTVAGADPSQTPVPNKVPALATIQTRTDDTSATASQVSTDGQPANASVIEMRVPEGAENVGMAVQIVASQDTWVSITANGKKLFSGTLKANEARKIIGVATAKMVIGNAGGVEVQTDGRSIGPIGPVGQVRVVTLSPDGPKIMKNKSAEDSAASKTD